MKLVKRNGKLIAMREETRSLRFSHVPVLLTECLKALDLKANGTYVDCTAGGAGHSAAILQRLGSGGRLFAFDKDPTARQAAAAKLAQVKTAATYELIAADFASLREELSKRNVFAVDGILADLGVSSPQLDTGERGFAYRLEGPLDMRMNPTCGRTAADILRLEDQATLTRIMREYGEERYAARIAAAVVKTRETKPLTGTGELVDLICKAVPAAARREKQHPAKRVFQSLRIAVNDELGALRKLLQQAPGLLKPDGHLVIITFHSLEDRLVKQAFRRWERPCRCPSGLPCVCGLASQGKADPPHGLVAGKTELAENPRSRSARVRVFRRNANPPLVEIFSGEASD